MAELYDVAADDTDSMEAIAEGWRPYRTWATLLLRVWLEDQTGEIAGGAAPTPAAREARAKGS